LAEGDSNTQQEYIKGIVKEFEDALAPGRVGGGGGGFMVFTISFAGIVDENGVDSR